MASTLRPREPPGWSQGPGGPDDTEGLTARPRYPGRVTSPTASLRRRVLPAIALAVALLAVWTLVRGPDAAEDGDVVARGPAGEDAPGPLVVEPVLRGAADARPAPAADERAGPDRDPLGWRITFEVVGMDGTPLAWDLAAFRDARGDALEHVRAPRDATTGFLDVTGEGRLVVQAEGFVPWMSGWLARPVAGTIHLVARLDAGLAVAGEVFEQDGRTPLAAGSVLVICNGGALPDGTSFGQQGEVEDGRFRVTGLAPGPVDVQVRGAHRQAGQPARTLAQAGDEDLRIVLGPWGRITLLLVDERTGFAPVTTYLQVFEIGDDGVAMPCLTTSTTAPAEGQPPTSLGGFDAAPGARLRYCVEAQGYEPSDVFEVVVPLSGGVVETRVGLRPAPRSVGRVRLRLRVESGVLPEHVLVARHDAGGSTGRGYPVEAGVVSLELGPGAHHLVVGDAWAPSDPGPDWVPVPVHVELAPGQEREVDVLLCPGGWVFLAGGGDLRPETVRWLSGSDTREVRARHHRMGETDGYLLGLLPPGRWGLWLVETRGGDRTASVEVRAGEVVRLDPAALAPVGDEDPRRGGR